MNDLLTYRLSDFIPFSAQTWRDLVESYNQDLWPIQALIVLLTVVVIVTGRLSRRSMTWRRTACTGLAALWVFVGWQFLAMRYATINWAATWFAAGFMLEAVLLVYFGVLKARLFDPVGTLLQRGTGLSLFVYALALKPTFDLVTGVPVAQMEVFGVMPDSLAIGTIGIVLASAGRQDRRVTGTLLLWPTLWCLISGLTLLGLELQGAMFLLVISVGTPAIIILSPLSRSPG